MIPKKNAAQNPKRAAAHAHTLHRFSTRLTCTAFQELSASRGIAGLGQFLGDLLQ